MITNIFRCRQTSKNASGRGLGVCERRFHSEASLMSEFEIRRLGTADVPAYRALFLEALLSAPSAFAADYEQESVRSLGKLASDSNGKRRTADLSRGVSEESRPSSSR